MKSDLSNSISDLKKIIQEYLKIHFEIFKVSALEKLTRFSVFILSTLIFVLIGTIFFLFMATAFIVWYGNTYNDYLTGLLIVSGVVLLFGIVFLLIRRSVITARIINTISSILFDQEENEKS